MSHDRKPGRVRVVPTGAVDTGRRPSGTPAVALDAVSVARAAKSRRRAQVLLALLFILSSIGAGIAIELRLPS